MTTTKTWLATAKAANTKPYDKTAVGAKASLELLREAAFYVNQRDQHNAKPEGRPLVVIVVADPNGVMLSDPQHGAHICSVIGQIAKDGARVGYQIEVLVDQVVDARLFGHHHAEVTAITKVAA